MSISNHKHTKHSSFSSKVKASCAMLVGTMATSFPTVILNNNVQHIGDCQEICGPITASHVLETKVTNIETEIVNTENSDKCPLLNHANLAMKRDLQFMDVINDENDEDWSFVPQDIVNHTVSKKF